MIETLFKELKSVGIDLFIEDDQLVFDAPMGSMTPELLARMHDCRVGLIDMLQRPKTPGALGANCPYCMELFFEDVNQGWRCCNCKRLAWIWLPCGSIVRADFESMDL
jgi:hypothetical protein